MKMCDLFELVFISRDANLEFNKVIYFRNTIPNGTFVFMRIINILLYVCHYLCSSGEFQGIQLRLTISMPGDRRLLLIHAHTFHPTTK